MSASDEQTSSNLSGDVDSVSPPPPVGADGCIECPVCHERVGAGIGHGSGNLKRHMEGGRCKKQAKKNKENEKKSRQQELVKSYFNGPKKVPPTVSQPSPIQSTPILRPKSLNATLPSNSSHTHPTQQINQPAQTVEAIDETSASGTSPTACQAGIACLAKFKERILALEDDIAIPEAGLDHELAAFSGDPTGCVQEDEDAWEKWDRPLNNLLQRNPLELRQLVARGPRGLMGLHRFLLYLVLNHGVQGALIEGKVDRLMNVINEISPQTARAPGICTSPKRSSEKQAVIDVDSLDLGRATDIDVVGSNTPQHPSRPRPPSSDSQSGSKISKKPLTHPCPGFHLVMPAGKSPHTAYPFALHEKLGDPWDYIVTGGQLFLRARGCLKISAGPDGTLCAECTRLPQNGHLIGIIDRMKDGVHINAPFSYHGTGGLIKIAREKSSRVIALKLRSLNDARKIISKSGALDDYKEWVMAVGSGKIERVERLVRNAIAQKRGIRGIIKMYADADEAVYRTRKYTDQDRSRALLLWRLGGARVAEIAHKSLGLPSLRTVRRMSTIRPLIISTGQPTVFDIEENTKTCLSLLSDLLKSAGVVHQVLKFDEIKNDERVRWDEKTNNIVGICREHGDNASLAFTSRHEADLLFEKVLNGDVHLATNTTIGAIGILSDEHRLYSALPVLVSGQCGRESGRQHASVLQTVITGAKVSKLRTVCLSSDGESRRGEAFAILTFKHVLKTTSPLYPLLSGLPWMNLEVGDDDLTADKDYKHVFKRIRNLLLRSRGLKVHGIHILPSVIQSHLLQNGSSISHVNSLLKPEDKQDVKLAYDLLREITSLPSLSEATRGPGFLDTREAFNTLGIFFRNIILPYICIDLTLTEQLTYLSTAAHILLAMAHEDQAGTQLMPTQLYVDIMIMIKNVYFCVAKTQVDNPGGKFFLMLLGTDRLEELFGILRTMVGNDSSVDVYQLALRLVGTTEVSGILSQYPEWDRAPRRLKLPTLSKDGLEIFKDVDHVKPSSWRGDVRVKDVNLKTCWLMGRYSVKHLLPRLDKVLTDLESEKDLSINILQPFGKHIVLAKRDIDDYDDTAEDFDEGLASTDPLATSSLPGTDAQPKHSLATDLEDAAGEEEPSTIHDPCFTHEGKTVFKARYLKELFKSLKETGSRDRLKRYADIPRYAIKNARLDIIESDVDSISNLPSVKMNYPIATILRCSGHLFVGIGEVIEISSASKLHDALPTHSLSDPSTSIQYQLLYLVAATVEDDPTHKNDWRWLHQRGASYRIPGRLVEPVNPDISTREAGRPFYLFDSQTLQAIGSLLLERLTANDGKLIPEIQASMNFPYREKDGKACFVCEDDAKEKEVFSQHECPYCLTSLPKSGQGVLKHMAAHIHFDPSIQAKNQPCGLCLRYSSCTFFLSKGKGADASPKVNERLSVCPNLVHFNYSTATTSTAASPCSNVPLPCRECPAGSPAIWRYNFLEHLKSRHPHVDPNVYQSIWSIGKAEKAGLKKIWEDRLRVKKKRASKKSKTTALVISEAHSSHLTLPSDENVEDAEGTDEETLEDVEDEDEYEEPEDLNHEDARSATEAERPDIIGCEEEHVISDEQRDTEDEPLPTSPLERNISPSQDVPNVHPLDDNLLAPDIGQSCNTGRQTRKRKNRVVIDDCICGEVVSQRDIQARSGVIECKRQGCETRWFHLICVDLEYPVNNWTCESCGAAKKRRS